MLLLLLLVAGVTNTLAQNVTIRANNGSTIPAVKSGSTTDTFFGSGGFATWQHEQLSMVLTVSDNKELTPNEQLDNPANNLFTSGNSIQIGKGQVTGANVTYVSLSLPKGYRFTKYEIKFSKSTETKTANYGRQFSTDFNSPVTSRFGETGKTFGDYTTSADVENGGAAQIITRTEGAGGEMGNVLYFKLINTTTDDRGHWEYSFGGREWVSDGNNRALITLESAEFWFTAEENYAPVTPATDILGVSAVDIPFSTSKVDYGSIERRPYQINGRTYYRVSYNSADLTDLSAYLHLYEAESTTSGTDIDGSSGDVIDYKTGSISSDGGYFKLGNANKEQVYYLETPTYVTLSDGTKNPVGYRITGATIEYANKITASRTFRITHDYVYNGRTYKYYLYTNGSNVGWSTTNQSTWTMDEDGYIKSGNYYLYFDNGYAAVQTQKPGESERFAVGENGIYQVGWAEYYIRWYVQNNTAYCLISKDYGENATYSEISTSTETHNFTLKVYDKNGENPVSYKNGNGTVPLTGLNNDAIKFGVQGIGLVRATLTLQALDPYLNSMEVVCQDEVQTQVRLSQPFTASDFSVSGGEFYFYLPTDCNGHQVAITFENLDSKYFDETYSGGSASHTSRLNFVKSQHYNAFGTSNNNIYTNRSEAASSTVETARLAADNGKGIMVRTKVGTVGTAAFKFNNADEVGTGTGGTLTEYPFSLENYTGSFSDMKFTVSAADQTATRYVFTTDETRYNIAPTTATQHRAYAFYQMIIHVQTQTYEPKVYFTKIYDPTLYRERLRDKDGKLTGEYGDAKTDAFYGVKVTAYDGNTPPKPGYSSTAAIFEAINKAIQNKKDDAGNTDVPSSQDKLLYLDFSEMAGIYQTTTDTHGSMEDFAATNAANCLIFIPKGATAPNNNVCYMTESGSFMAAQNIVLTDMQPFYSPYDISVDAEKKIEYKRLVTTDKYGKVQNASLILPFALKLEGGKHTNADGSSFSLHTMEAGQTLQIKDGQLVAYFPAMEDVTLAAANTPYLVKIDGNSEGEGNANVTFTVSQTGGTIMKTEGIMEADYTISGTAVTNVTAGGTTSAGAGTYTFTPKGTFAGQQVPKANNIFYFASNVFVNSKDYKYSAINVAPFRAYFTTSTPGAKLASFGITFDEIIDSDPTGISSFTCNPDLMVIPGNGIITMKSTIEQNVRVNSMSGVLVNNTKLQAGETQTINVPAGVYVINGVKIIVK
jgi:hypothetical protein